MTETTTTPNETRFTRELSYYLRAGYQTLYIPSTEERRVMKELSLLAVEWESHGLSSPANYRDGNGAALPIVTWSCAEGLSCLTEAREKAASRVPTTALDFLYSDDEEDAESVIPRNALIVFHDLDDFFSDPAVRRRLRAINEEQRLVSADRSRPLIIISPQLQVHPRIKEAVTVVEFALPNKADMEETLEYLQACTQAPLQASIDRATGSDRETLEAKRQRLELSAELKERLADNLLGLTRAEAENCVSRCLVVHGGFSEEIRQTVQDEKASIVRKGGLLTYIPKSQKTDLAHIGGFENYLEWLSLIKVAYSDAAASQQIDLPKGAALIGFPGTGKSVVAKTTCDALGLPGYILDVGSLFGSLVGESEQRTRDVLKQVDAQQGCVLVLDEVDKALGNAADSTGDSGVTRRVFGTILTWLAEADSRTFVIMTLNRTDGLPPEFLRDGRIDELFYTDLPTPTERRAIMEIHLRKRGVDLESLDLTDNDWASLADATAQFVGSELENVIVESRLKAFAATGAGRPTFENLLNAANGKVPLAVRDASGMDKIREFCRDKAKPVSRLATPNTEKRRKSRRISVN